MMQISAVQLLWLKFTVLLLVSIIVSSNTKVISRV